MGHQAPIQVVGNDRSRADEHERKCSHPLGNTLIYSGSTYHASE